MSESQTHTSVQQGRGFVQSGSFGCDGPLLLVHGGAWDIPDHELPGHRRGLEEALALGSKRLLEGATAIDAVCDVVAGMEVHGAFDAGCGSVLTEDGIVQMDAGLMDGERLLYGAVAAVERYSHPIRLAHALLEDEEAKVRFLTTRRGLCALAERAGESEIEPSELICDRERRRYEKLKNEQDRIHPSDPFLGAGPAPTGTVGCVARDVSGRLAAATSTGGTPFRPSGRVGDSPLPGCGYYADNHAAASATGWGEAISAWMLSGRTVLSSHRNGRIQTAAKKALEGMYHSVAGPNGKGARGGIICVLADGPAAWAFSTPRMARAGWSPSAKSFIEFD